MLTMTSPVFQNAELGINRVTVGSALSPGIVRVTASRPGLEGAEIAIESKAVRLVNGVSTSCHNSIPG
jgi:hypothetical protein